MAIQTSEWVGQELAGGRYLITSKLGEGGMGSVYKANDRNLDTPVVVKVPRLNLVDDEEFAVRFQHEIRSLVQLNHPHIVKIIDVGKHGEQPFAVMQFLGGGSLEDRQSSDRDGCSLAVEPAAILEWLGDVAAALDFVHQRGYLHRDVKPANILFDEYGNVYLSDFGISKVISGREGASTTQALTGAGLVLGTAEYVAPEIVMGATADGRADQYSLAVMLFELLSGRRPFEGSPASAVLVKQSTQAPPELSGQAPRLAKAVCDVVHRGLLKEPNKRFSNCGELAQAFASAAQLAGPARTTTTGRTSTSNRVRVRCPDCGAKLRLKEQALGQSVECPKCQTSFQIPKDVADKGESAQGTDQVRTTQKVDFGQGGVLGGAATPGPGRRVTQVVAAPGQGPPPLPASQRPATMKVNPGEANQAQTMVAMAAPDVRKSRSPMMLVAAGGIAVVAVIGLALLLVGGNDRSDDNVELAENSSAENLATVESDSTDSVDRGSPEATGKPSESVGSDGEGDLTGGGSNSHEAVTEDDGDDEGEPSPFGKEGGNEQELALLRAKIADLEKKAAARNKRVPSAPSNVAEAVDAGKKLTTSATREPAESPADAVPLAPGEIDPAEQQRRAKVGAAVARKAPLPLLRSSVEAQNLIDLATGKDKLPYKLPPKRYVTRRVGTPRFGGGVSESRTVRRETPQSMATRAAYKAAYAVQSRRYIDEKLDTFQSEMQQRAASEPRYGDEMREDLELIRNTSDLVMAGGAQRDDVERFCRYVTEFAVKFGDDSTIPPTYFEDPDLAMDDPAEFKREAERLRKSAKLKRAAAKRHEYSNREKHAELMKEAEELEAEAVELDRKAKQLASNSEGDKSQSDKPEAPAQ